MAHTPGPWILDCKKLHSPTLAVGGYHTIDAGDRCNCPDKGFVGFGVAGFMSSADAHLIAAAPDLLAALEEAELHIEWTGATSDLLECIRAAIHLAKHGAFVAPAQAEQS